MEALRNARHPSKPLIRDRLRTESNGKIAVVEGEFSTVGEDSAKVRSELQVQRDEIAMMFARQTRILVATMTVCFLPICIYLWVVALI